MEELKAKLSCELIADEGPNGEDTRCDIHMEGTLNMLLNAYQQISLRLLNTMKEDYGKHVAMALHAHVQSMVLEEFGVDLKSEAERAAAEIVDKQKNEKRRDALLSILGKTFKMPEKKEGEAE